MKILKGNFPNQKDEMMMTLKKYASAAAVLVAALVMQSPANALGPAAGGGYQTGYACTNSGGNLILRAGPGQNFAKLMGIGHGVQLVVLDEISGRDGFSWYKVRVGKRIGYVRYDYVCGL